MMQFWYSLRFCLSQTCWTTLFCYWLHYFKTFGVGVPRLFNQWINYNEVCSNLCSWLNSLAQNDSICPRSGYSFPQNRIQLAQNRIQFPQNRIQLFPEPDTVFPRTGYSWHRAGYSFAQSRIQFCPEPDTVFPRSRYSWPQNWVQFALMSPSLYGQ